MKGDDSVFLSKPKQTYTLKLIVWGRLLFKLRVNLIKQKLLKLVVSKRLVPSLELEKAWGRLLNLRDKPKQTVFFGNRVPNLIFLFRNMYVDDSPKEIAYLNI